MHVGDCDWPLVDRLSLVHGRHQLSDGLMAVWCGKALLARRKRLSLLLSSLGLSSTQSFGSLSV